jgi:hypothetical protein
MTFSGGRNGDGVCKYKKKTLNTFLTKYIKSILWKVAVRVSYIEDAWGLKVNFPSKTL